MKTYYTKCGRQFEKSSTAAVTGYHLPKGDSQCEECPFRVEVKENWPPVFKRWECRAGSLPPNQKNDWQGSIEDKNTIHIYSLHNDFLESIIEYCKGQSDVSASYNQDDADCRRNLSISCSGNKKGVAAKKALIERFFPALEDKAAKDRELLSKIIGKEIRTHYNTGGIVTNIIGPHNAYGPGSWTINYTKDGKKSKTPSIINSIKIEAGIITCDGKPLQIIDQKENNKPEICASCENEGTGCAPNNPESEMCIAYVEKSEPKRYVDTTTGRLIFVRAGIGFNGYKAMYQDAGKWGSGRAHSVKSSNLPWRNTPEEAQADLDAYAKKKGWKEYVEERKEANKVHIDSSQKCDFKDDQCPYYCSHNEGCALKLSKSEAVKYMIKEMKPYNCDTYHLMKQKYFPEQPTVERADVIGTNLEEATPVTAFDYSTVDVDTAAFLQEKEQKITQIRMMSVMAIGKELKEVHEKLANHYQGSFGKWCEAIGISRMTADRYIKAYDYVVTNCDNIEAAENIQPSLLFAISKPSAPAELQKAVLDGDITSHKKYKELEEKLKIMDEAAKKAIAAAEENRDKAHEAQKKAEQAERALKQSQDEHKSKNSRHEWEVNNLNRTIQDLRAQIEQASEPAEVQKLRDELTEAQRQVEILKDELMTPLDLEPAVVEKVPEEVERELAELRKKTIFAEDYNLIADVLGKLITAHPGMLKNWAKVAGKENSKDSLLAIKGELIGIRTKLESMIDYLDDEIQMK